MVIRAVDAGPGQFKRGRLRCLGGLRPPAVGRGHGVRPAAQVEERPPGVKPEAGVQRKRVAVLAAEGHPVPVAWPEAGQHRPAAAAAVHLWGDEQVAQQADRAGAGAQLAGRAKSDDAAAHHPPTTTLPCASRWFM